MIDSIVQAFHKSEESLRDKFLNNHVYDYSEIVKILIEELNTNLHKNDRWDPERITEIDEGDYQGTKLFVIGEEGYQPNSYLTTKAYYGSCSACDTLQGINECDFGESEQQDKEIVDDYMTLCLHLVQQMKII
jgi:hypothetical protein